jgi:hypothetical protein
VRAFASSQLVQVGVRVWLCAGLALAPVTGVAAPPTVDSEDAASSEDADEAPDQTMLEAKRLFDAGVARYTAADYKAAVDLWLEAYTMIPSTFENRLVKAEIIYNVARAEQKAFQIDQDVTHLRQARAILAGYSDEISDLYPSDQAALERERIHEQIDELEVQIARWEAQQARRENELAERMRPGFDEQADAREERRNKPMIGAGAGLTALGIGGVGLFVAGLVMARSAQASVGALQLQADIPAREAAIDRGDTGNALLVIGTLSGAVFLAVGAPLLGVGLVAEKQRKQRRRAAGLSHAGAGPQLQQLGPIVLPGGGGVGLGGRF